MVAGESFQGDDNVLSEFTLVRYNPNGGFGSGGVANTVIPEPSVEPVNADAYALAILPSGEILAAGSSNWGGIYGSSSFVLAEYRADGSLDPIFGDGGIAQTQFNGQGGLAGIAVQPDGKIVAGGLGGLGQRIALARYEPDGSLDPTFGSGGKVTTDLRLLKLNYVGGQPVLEHGKIVVVGETRVNDVTDKWLPVLTRYQASGRLDSTFGKHGFVKVRNQMGGPNAVLAQPDGKIVMAEYSTAQEWSAIVRLLPDGRPDTHSGVGGSVSSGDTILRLALQTDGKILFGGVEPERPRVGTLPTRRRQQLRGLRTPRQDALGGSRHARDVVLSPRTRDQALLEQARSGARDLRRAKTGGPASRRREGRSRRQQRQTALATLQRLQP